MLSRGRFCILNVWMKWRTKAFGSLNQPLKNGWKTSSGKNERDDTRKTEYTEISVNVVFTSSRNTVFFTLNPLKAFLKKFTVVLWSNNFIFLWLCYCRCSVARLKLFLVTYVPILGWLPRYPIKENGIRDLISGSSIAVMHLPQSE